MRKDYQSISESVVVSFNKLTFSHISCAESNMSLTLPIPPPIDTPWLLLKLKYSAKELSKIGLVNQPY